MGGLSVNNMKDSKINWIGYMPKDWEITKIKYIAELNGRIGWQGLTSSEYIDEGPFLITGTDFKDGGINWDTCVHITKARWEEAKKIQINNGDLLITKDGTVGKVAIVDNLRGLASLNSGVLKIELDKGFSNKYLYYVLQSQVFWNWFNYTSSGNSTILHLYEKDFNNFIFCLPNEKEQMKIAGFLDSEVGKINDLIRKTEKQIEILEEYKKSLIAETVTKGLDKTAVYKDTGIDWIGEIPENWEVKRARYVVNFKTGGTPPEKRGIVDEGEIPWITAPDMDQGFDLIEANNYITPSAVNENKYSLFPAGSILFVCIASVGKLGITHTDSYSNQQITALMPVNIESRFLLYYMSFASGKIIKDASSNVVPIVNTSYLKNLSIILPSKKEQNEISGYLDDKLKHIDAVISFKRKQNKKIKDIKDSLIYEYVTGKKRVGG